LTAENTGGILPVLNLFSQVLEFTSNRPQGQMTPTRDVPRQELFVNLPKAVSSVQGIASSNELFLAYQPYSTELPMSWESPQFRTGSLALFAAGVAVLFLSLSLAHSFSVSAQPNPQEHASAGTLRLMLPAIVGGLLTFVGGIRVSLFARPWILIIGGTFLLFTSWFAPALVSGIPALPNFSWTGPALLILILLRILGLIFSATGVLRLLRKQPPTAHRA